MRLYVYADESGSFSRDSGTPFAYGGVCVLGRDAKDALARRYIAVERAVSSECCGISDGTEVKACFVGMRDRRRLLSVSSERCAQFAVIVNRDRVFDRVYATKRDRQRFLDYLLKRGIKHCVERGMRDGTFNRSDIDSMTVIVDEHGTSTSGKYRLAESINEEFRHGVWNPWFTSMIQPVFGTDFPEIPLAYVDSRNVPLVRLADVTANWAYCAERDAKTAPQAMRLLNRRACVLRLP